MITHLQRCICIILPAEAVEWLFVEHFRDYDKWPWSRFNSPRRQYEDLKSSHMMCEIWISFVVVFNPSSKFFWFQSSLQQNHLIWTPGPWNLNSNVILIICTPSLATWFGWPLCFCFDLSEEHTSFLFGEVADSKSTWMPGTWNQ